MNELNIFSVKVCWHPTLTTKPTLILHEVSHLTSGVFRLINLLQQCDMTFWA
jgi:hypothetical protein